MWLLFEQEPGTTARIKYYLVNLPARRSRRALVRLAHQRWAIEQPYQEHRGPPGLDNFEGRNYPGREHHLVLTTVRHAFLQRERMRPTTGPPLTFPVIRTIVQETFTLYPFAPRPHDLKLLDELRTLRLQI